MITDGFDNDRTAPETFNCYILAKMLHIIVVKVFFTSVSISTMLLLNKICLNKSNAVFYALHILSHGQYESI